MSVAYLMIIIDENLHEEESDTNRNEEHEKRTDGTKIGGEMGQDGERWMEKEERRIQRQ